VERDIRWVTFIWPESALTTNVFNRVAERSRLFEIPFELL